MIFSPIHIIFYYIVRGCKDVEPDEDHCVEVNLFMSNYAKAAIATNTITKLSSTAAADGKLLLEEPELDQEE